MIGRGAHGNPWIFTEIQHFLSTGNILQKPSIKTQQKTIIQHIQSIHQFYGDYMGVRFARKHVGWYFEVLKKPSIHRKAFNQLQSTTAQLNFLSNYMRL